MARQLVTLHACAAMRRQRTVPCRRNGPASLQCFPSQFWLKLCRVVPGGFCGLHVGVWGAPCAYSHRPKLNTVCSRARRHVPSLVSTVVDRLHMPSKRAHRCLSSRVALSSRCCRVGATTRVCRNTALSRALGRCLARRSPCTDTHGRTHIRDAHPRLFRVPFESTGRHASY